MKNTNTNKLSAAKTILLAWIIAGTLDILGAITVSCYIRKAITPIQLLDGIAAGVFGKTIIVNENVTAIIGLMFHYIIVFCFTVFYFFIYPKIKLLHYNKILSAVIYAVCVWIVMSFIVVPLSNAYHPTYTLASASRAITILIFCIGFPICFITANYYKKRLAVQ